MKTTFLILLVIPFLGIVSSDSGESSTKAPKAREATCVHVADGVPEEWIRMAESCTNEMRDQIQVELEAAMTYLSMGAHFSQAHKNRPGFAKYFFESASEERGHAIKLIEYLLMRTKSEPLVDHLIKKPKPENMTLSDGVTALENALKLEARVTVKIRDIIAACEEGEIDSEKFNDYHLVEYLSGEFLEEQYKGQRQLAGMISTLKKMRHAEGALGEYLFDKKLLNNELF